LLPRNLFFSPNSYRSISSEEHWQGFLRFW
jgi:hypothetical protein